MVQLKRYSLMETGLNNEQINAMAIAIAFLNFYLGIKYKDNENKTTAISAKLNDIFSDFLNSLLDFSFSALFDFLTAFRISFRDIAIVTPAISSATVNSQNNASLISTSVKLTIKKLIIYPDVKEQSYNSFILSFDFSLTNDTYIAYINRYQGNSYNLLYIPLWLGK